MRILHVTDASAAGVLASVTALANAQAAMPEVETVRFCYTPRPESPPHPSIAQNLGGDVEVVRWERSSRRALLGLVRGLRREYRRGDWDLVHLHSSRAGFIGRILAALTDHHAGIVYSPHGFAFNRKDFNPLLVRAFLAMERLALHGGRRIVVVSESEAGVAHTQLRGSQSAVLPNSVDLKVFTSPEVDTESSLQKPIKVVHLGRIMDQKRPRVFADIAARAHKSFPGRFDFTWIGDGDRELLASEDASVKITGWLSADDIRGQLSQSDILLFTSAGEGLPISLLEAQAMRLATIGENVVGIRDLVTDGVEGRLFNTVDEAIDALGWLLSPEQRSECGTAARRRVERDHDQARLGPRSLAAYRAIGALDSPRKFPSNNSSAKHSESRMS